MSQSSNDLKQTLNNIEVQILGAQLLDDDEFTSLLELIDEFGHKFLSDNEFAAAVATSHEDIPVGTSKKFIQIEEILEVVNEIRLKIIDKTKDQTEIADIFDVTKSYEAAIAAKLKDPSIRVPALPQSTQKIIQFLSHLNIPPEAIEATAAVVASSANQAPEEALSRLYQVVHSIDPAISTADIVNGLSPLVDSLSGQPDVVIKKIGVTSEIPKLAENSEAALKITTTALLHPEGADTYSQGVFANADITVEPEVLSRALNSHLSPVDALTQAISLYTGASLEAARQVATSTAAYNLILQYNPNLDPNEKLRVLVDQLGLSLTEKASRGVVPNENSPQVKDIQTLLTVSPTGTAIPPSTAFFIVQNLVDPHTALPLSDTYTSAARKIFQAQSATTLAAFTELFGADAAKLIINNNLHLAAAQLAAAADPSFNYLHTANAGALLVNFISAQPGLQSKKPTTNPELQRYHDLLQLFHGPLLFQSGNQVAAKFHLFITSQPTNDTVNRAYSNSQYSQSVTDSVGPEFRSALSLNISHLNLFNPLISRGQNTLVYRGFNAFANSGLGQKFFATSVGKGTGKVLAKMVGSKLATKLGLQAVGSVVPGIGNFVALVAGVVLDLVGKIGRFLFGDTFSNLGKDVSDTAKGGAVALLMGASGVGGAVTGAVSALIAGIIAVMSIVVMALATPIVIGLISIPIAVAFFLFIINTGAYITPPSFTVPNSQGVFESPLGPAQSAVGSCPVPNGSTGCGSYNSPTAQSCHGTNSYWGASVKGQCAYGIPLDSPTSLNGGRCQRVRTGTPGYENADCHLDTSTCTTYGFAADVPPSGPTAESRSAYLPKLADSSGNVISRQWTRVTTLFTIFGGSWGYGVFYKTSDSLTPTYEMYFGHIASNSPVPKTGTSGDLIGPLFSGTGFGTHLHIELKINGVDAIPDPLCQGK